MQIFVKCLRSTETLGIAEADVHILSGIVSDIGTRAEDSFVHNTVLIYTSTDQKAPLFVVPFVLYIGTCNVHHLIQGSRRVFVNQLLQTVARCTGIFVQSSITVLLHVRSLVMKVVVVELNASGQIGRHEQTFVKVINILGTQHSGEVCRHAIGTVITVTHNVLGRSIGAERMLLISGECREFKSSRIDGMSELLHQSGFTGSVQVCILGNMGRQAKTAAATTEFLHVVVFQAQLGIGACPVISIQAYRLISQFRQLGKAVSIGVPCRTMPVLPVDISSHLIVGRNQGKIQRRIVIERAGTVEVGNGMRK